MEDTDEVTVQCDCCEMLMVVDLRVYSEEEFIEGPIFCSTECAYPDGNEPLDTY